MLVLILSYSYLLSSTIVMNQSYSNTDPYPLLLQPLLTTIEVTFNLLPSSPPMDLAPRRAPRTAPQRLRHLSGLGQALQRLLGLQLHRCHGVGHRKVEIR